MRLPLVLAMEIQTRRYFSFGSMLYLVSSVVWIVRSIIPHDYVALNVVCCYKLSLKSMIKLHVL
jgi:hypothetical protein